jgi:hypothetical protein
MIASLAANAEFEGVMVDMEHTVVGLETASAIFGACMSAGCVSDANHCITHPPIESIYLHL